MIILGIDSSTRSTGWAVINTDYEGSLRLLSYGTIAPKSSKMDAIDRIINIVKELISIIESYNPEFVVIEEMNVSRNMNTVRVLAGLLTAIEMLLRRRELLYIKMTPSAWRKRVGINPSAKREVLKEQSRFFVERNYNESVLEDEADAICIAEAGSTMEVEYE